MYIGFNERLDLLSDYKLLKNYSGSIEFQLNLSLIYALTKQPKCQL
jgi:hypothetical protein